jgi:inosose dehydratase
MAKPLIAASQITWGRFRSSGEWTEEKTLQAIADAGYEGAPAGPRKDRTPKDTVALYARFGLKPAPGYLGADFWKPEKRAEILEQAQRQAEYAAGMGLDCLYVAAGGWGDVLPGIGKTRKQVSTHIKPEHSLKADEYKRFGDVLNEVGALTLKSGVMSCFHNHVGTYIETRKEFDALLAVCDPSKVFLGPDTGHLAWAGADVVSFTRAYAPRIKTVHLKDIYPVVLKKGLAEGWDYDQYSAAGIFAEIGEGLIDFKTTFEILKGVGFAGWVIVEIDATTKSSPVESIQIGRKYLRSIGL